MNAMKMSLQSQVELAAKPGKPNIALKLTEESRTFDSIMESMSTEASAPVQADHTAETQKGNLIGNLEEVLKALQEVPEESLSPEEQEILGALMEMLSVQMTKLETQPSVQGQELTMQVLQVQEKVLDQEQHVLSGAGSKIFENLQELMGVGEKNSPADTKKAEQAFKQLVTLIQPLETEMASAEGQTAGKSVLALRLLGELAKAPENTAAETIRPTAFPAENAIKQAAAPLTETPIARGMQTEQIQPEATSTPVAGSTGNETAKTVQAPVRPEAAIPTVRLSNLIEDMSEVLKGSLRLNGTKEGTQIRMSIFPEHLGHLDIRLTEINGKIAAQIFTSNLVAKDVLDQQVNQLRQSLLQQGVELDKVEIAQQPSFSQPNTHPDQRFSQNQQRQGNLSRQRNGYQLVEEETIAVAERRQSAVGTMKVDYTI